MEDIPIPRKYCPKYGRGYAAKNSRYRLDPVPRTGKGNKTFGHYFKHPGTAAEKKEWFKSQYSLEESHNKIKFRRDRSMGNLPSLWDDKPIVKQRNWKRYRKNQYKAYRNRG